MQSSPAFSTTAIPSSSLSTFRGRAVCPNFEAPNFVAHANTSTLRMASVPAVKQQPQQQSLTTEPSVETPINWPPAEMTDEWAEAVLRLANSVKGVSLDAADNALEGADGDEMLALKSLTEDNQTDIQKKRQRAVEAARAAGDVNRVSAIKEAELRRTATGSARDFFKGFVEVEGQYVDAGYVDESADTMGRLMGSLKRLFGNKN